MFILGTAPFSPTSSWNQATPTNSTYSKLNWPATNGYNYSVAWDAYSPSVYIASASDPVVQVSVPGGWGYPAGNVSVHMPAAANGASGTDGELVVIDGDVAYNFWQFNRTGATTAKAASYGAENVVTGDGWGSKSPFLSAGITAAGASELGGLLVKAETDKGQIDHALQLVVDSKLVNSGFTGNAIAGDGSSAAGIVQEGDHLGIPPGTPMPAGLSPLGQEVFRAMQQYGAYVIDVAGGVTNVRAQANAYDPSTMTALWHDMGNITPLLQRVSTNGASAAATPTPAPTATPTSTSAAGATPSSTAASGSGIAAGHGNASSGTVQPDQTTGAGQAKPDVAVNTVAGDNNAADSSVNVAAAPGTTVGNGDASSGTVQPDQTIGAGQAKPDIAVNTVAGVNDPAGNSVTVAGTPGTTAGNGNPGSGTVQPDLTIAAGQAKPATYLAGVNDLAGNSPNVAGTPGTAAAGGSLSSGTVQPDLAIGAGQAKPDPAGTNLAGANDLAGTSANVVGAPTGESGTLAINPDANTHANVPTVDNVTTASAGRRAGTITLDMSENVLVNGTPSLLLDNGQTAAYKSGSGTDTLTFAYNSYRGGNGSGPEVAGLVLPASSSITDSTGHDADLSGAGGSTTGRGFSVINGSELELFGASKDFVFFRPGPGGELKLDAASEFTGRVAGFSGDDKLALADISFGNKTTLGYAENGSHTGGTLSVSDGELTAKIALLGQYSASSFAMSADTSGGTLIQAAPASALTPTLAKPHSV